MTRRDEWAEPPRAISIVHDIPGRLRLRLPPRADVEGLKQAIDGLNGVLSSVWSPRTRSLLIRYAANVLTPTEIIRAVADHADVDAPTASGERRGDESRAPIASAIVDVFSGLNERVARRTRGRLDLGILIPVALVLWAGRQLLRGPVTSLSWTSSLWYAHGLFRDYLARER